MGAELLRHESVIWINARFLTRPITGVERVAREVITALVDHHLDASGHWHGGGAPVRFALIAPGTPETVINPWPQLSLRQAGLFQGHAWEQWDLPRLTAGQYLLNLCNTGPMFKHRQWTFLHDAQTFAIPQNFRPGLRYWYRLLFWWTARFSSGILTNSDFSAAELHRYLGAGGQRWTVAHLGADHVGRIVPDTSPRLHSLFDRLGTCPFVLAVSSDNPNKNFSAVVKALDMMGEAAPVCVIVGTRNDRVFEATRLDTRRVHHLGYVSDAELVALYRQASVMVYPSFYEGFGLPPLEAMWHGCPVVVSRTSAMPEVCADAALYCDPHDPASLAQALGELLKYEGLRLKMARLGRDRARTFVWQKTAERILQAMRQSLRR